MKRAFGIHNSPIHWKISRRILLLGAVVGLASFAYYYSIGLTTAHYDAKAHLVVARRIVDSPAPGYIQMGMNWLPLTHLLYLPFVLIEFQYRTGFIPSLISVASFVLSGWLVFRIALRITQSLRVGIFAGIVFLANPNLLYLQSCPLTEPLFVVLFLFAIDRFLAWREMPHESLPWFSSIGVSLGVMCRYEGWLLLAGIVLLLLIEAWNGRVSRAKALKAGVLYSGFSLLPLAMHFGYIYSRIGSSFLHQVARGNPAPFETQGRPLLSLAYHLGELSQIAALLPLIYGFAGIVYGCIDRRRLGRFYPLFLLWVPSTVNVAALCWGMVYRIRYSALLLPAIAIWGGVAVSSGPLAGGTFIAAALLSMLLPWIAYLVPQEWRYHDLFPGPGAWALPVMALLLFLMKQQTKKSFLPSIALCVLWMHFPVTQGENRPILAESLEHNFIEPERQQVLRYIRNHYDGTRIILDMGKLAPLAFDSGLPLKRFISNEDDRILWRKAMEAPESSAGWIFAQRGDEVWNRLQVDPHWLDKYSLAVQTEHFGLYRLQDKYREPFLPGGRLQ